MAVRRQTRRKKIQTPGPNQCHPAIDKYGRINKDLCLPTEVLERSAAILKVPVKDISDKIGVKKTDRRSFLMALPIEQNEKIQLAEKYLRPAMPSAWKDDPDMWLDSNNIRDVMKQYEVARSDFKFLGPFPIDFAAKDPYVKEETCLIREMCSLNLGKESIKGKKKIGIIFNLDTHDKGGSHWVAAFIDIPKKACYYFDSYGYEPPKQIYNFMQSLGVQEPKIKLGWNGRRFQYSNSECGMYSMYFIDRMLAGEPYLKFCRRAPPDRFMLDMRDWMFST